MPMPAMNVGMILQIVLALVIVLILYIITLVVLNIDTIVLQNSNRVKDHETSLLLRGYAPISYLGYKSFNTYNSFADNFRKIPRSLNTSGGAQFTYQFWVKIDDPTDSLFKDLVVLLKGDNRKYKIGLYDLVSKTKTVALPDDYAISCPLIKFVDSYRHLSVQFNTLNNPKTSIDISMNPNDGTMARRNTLSLLPLTWYLFTFTFEDNFSPASARENGIIFRFWLNDFLCQENTASEFPALRNNTLKQNDGDLFLFPNPPENGSFLRIGDLKYYNWSLEDEEIRTAYQAGPPTKSAIETDNQTNKPPYLGAYNKIDVTNY